MKSLIFGISSLGFCLGSLAWASECSDVQEPVCGNNGVTYQNICRLQSAPSVLLDYEGECFPEPFLPAEDFARAVELFNLKQNQITPNYASGREMLNEKLSAISHWLHSYNFAESVRGELVTQINDFVSINPNDQTLNQLEDSAEALKSDILSTKEKSAQKKYETDLIPFLDTDEGDWFTPFVAFLKEKEWISGYKDREGNPTGIFDPAGLVTKAEVTKMAFRMAGVEENIEKIPENVRAQDHWSRHWVAQAEDRALSLWSAGADPDQRATRAEVLQLIYEVLAIAPSRSAVSDFPDVTTGDRYFPYIQDAKNNGIISGYPDGYFRPDENISRAEIAKVIKQAFETLEIPKVVVLEEASEAILEAESLVSLDSMSREDIQKYAVEYVSQPFEFVMEVPGFFHFRAFPSEENELMRFGFSRKAEMEEGDVDFWLKIIGTEEPITRFIQKKISGQMVLEFPREGFSKSFFRIEGDESFSEFMSLLQQSIQYQRADEIPTIEPASLAPVLETPEIPASIAENLSTSEGTCEGRAVVRGNGETQCYLKTSDIGHTCYRGTECESGFCMAPQNGSVEGACYGEIPLSGCVRVINDGVVTEVCE